MNIAILSSTSSYHHLAQLLAKESNVTRVFHFGANPALAEQDKYVPFAMDLPPDKSVHEQIKQVEEFVKHNKIDYMMASGLSIPRNHYLDSVLREYKIPRFFVRPPLYGHEEQHPGLTALEQDKGRAKKVLQSLDIPTGIGDTITGQELFERFKTIPRPFVVKLNYVYQYGRQTIIVRDEDVEEVYLDLFSKHIGDGYRVTNIELTDTLVLENFIKIKREYSYHMMINASNWRYLGAARDYKKLNDGDTGFNTVSMGSYNIDDVDPIVHTYAAKLFHWFNTKVTRNRGFIFIGIAVDENDIPVVLEINTRSGDPELQAILGSVENNLADLFLTASLSEEMPEITHNQNKTVTVRLINRVYDWTKQASYLPQLAPPPDGIIHGLEGEERYIKHSVFTANGETHEDAARKIYGYLDQQQVGQYMYRRDIGIFK